MQLKSLLKNNKKSVFILCNNIASFNSFKVLSFQSLKVILTQESLLVLDYRGLNLERWLVLELAPQLALQTHSLPFEFRALEAILQHKVPHALRSHSK